MSMTVLAILETQDLLARDQPVLDDPVERPADELGRALRPHARDDADLPGKRSAGNPLLQHFEIAAGEGYLGQMELRHVMRMPNYP